MCLFAGTAFAADPTEEAEAPESIFDVAFGVSATTDYISRGITQTEHNPAIQGYVELDAGIFYGSVWASNVSFVGEGDTEFDFALGLRPEVDKASFDLGYVFYHYAVDSSADYGELYAMVDYAATDSFTFGGKVYYAPDYAQSDTSAIYGEVNGEYALPHDFALFAAVGYQAFDEEYGPSYLTWNAGLSWTWQDTLKLALTYSDTNLSSDDCAVLMDATDACDARVMFSVSVDSSLSALRGE